MNESRTPPQGPLTEPAPGHADHEPAPVSASDDNSVWDEPHLRPDGYRLDPSEQTAPRSRRAGDRDDTRDREDLRDRDHLVDHSVWDEPVLNPRLARKRPADAVTYRRWLSDKRAATSPGRTWLVTLLCALAAGPLALTGALLPNSIAAAGWSIFVAAAIIGPLTEEVLKIALPLWIAERKPYLFRSRAQIALCGLASGFVFAALENVLYLNVYIPDPSPGLVAWRWSVCVVLHMGCTAIASMGVMRTWSQAGQANARSRLSAATPLVITAVVIHGCYNALAMLLEFADYHF